MTTLQYEDSGYREKQIQREKEEFAIGFAEWLISRSYGEDLKLKDDTLEIYKKEKGL